MAKKTTNRKFTTNKDSSKGRKGGEVIVPSTIGAMAGAAIGGLAGLALGSETARKRLALVKDRAIKATGELLENVNVETEDIGEESTKAIKRSKKTSRKK